MTLTLRQLLDAWGTPQGASFEPDALVGRVCTDSRQLQAGDFFSPWWASDSMVIAFLPNCLNTRFRLLL